MIEFASGVEGVLGHVYFQLFCMYIFHVYKEYIGSLRGCHGQIGFFADVSRLK